MEYKGNQKRIFYQGAIYFITINTQNRIKYFSESIFCEIFIANLRLAKIFYKFDLYAFVIMTDHAHLLLMPYKTEELSKIMQFLKRHTARDINYILGYEFFYKTERAIRESLFRLQGYDNFFKIKGAINQSLLRSRLLRLKKRYLRYKSELKNYYKLLKKQKYKFISKYGNNQTSLSKFRWQKSYRDHYIRNYKDFKNHIKYVYKNPIKHKIPNAKNYQYIYTNYRELIT